MRKTLPMLALIAFPCIAMNATIRQIESTDGLIEFTNIKGDSKRFTTTDKKTSQKTIYKSKKGEVITFSDQKPQNVSEFEVLRFDCYACQPDSVIDWNTVKLNTTDYVTMIDQAARINQFEPALLRALVHAESAFKAKALSKQGAQGLTQLMPATAKQLGVRNAFDPFQNINGGARYLARMLRKFDGDTRLATAAYNAGPNAIKKYKGIPPYKETQVYVERVHILYERYRKAI
jgi:hypothetical protein